MSAKVLALPVWLTRAPLGVLHIIFTVSPYASLRDGVQ